MLGDRLGLPQRLDRRAPLPRGVLALLEPRDPLRRDRGAHREHPHRLRRAPAARSRTTTRSAPPSRSPCSTCSPTVASSSAPAARRRAPSSKGSTSTRTRRARCGARRSSTSWARGPRSTTRPTASTGRWARRARVQPKPLQQPAPADLGRDEQPRRAPRDRSSRHRPVLVHRRRPARGARRAARAVPRAVSPSASSRSGKFVNDQAATFTMVHCAPTNEQADAGRGRVVRLVREARRRAHRRRSPSCSRARTSAPTSTRPRRSRWSATGCFEPHHVRLPARLRLGRRRRPRRVHRGGEALRGDRLRPPALPRQPLQDPAREGHGVDRAARASTSSPRSPDHSTPQCPVIPLRESLRGRRRGRGRA